MGADYIAYGTEDVVIIVRDGYKEIGRFTIPKSKLRKNKETPLYFEIWGARAR